MRLLGPPSATERAVGAGPLEPQASVKSASKPPTPMRDLNEAVTSPSRERRSTSRVYHATSAGAPTISLSLRWILCFFE